MAHTSPRLAVVTAGITWPKMAQGNHDFSPRPRPAYMGYANAVHLAPALGTHNVQSFHVHQVLPRLALSVVSWPDGRATTGSRGFPELKFALPPLTVHS